MSIISGVALGVAVFGGTTDVKNGRVYNWLTYPAAVLGLLLNLYFYGSQGLTLGIAGWLVGLALLLIPYAMGVVGGGDVKLLAAMGAFFGPFNVVMVLLWGSLFGGVLALALLLKRRVLFGTLVALAASPRQSLTTQAKGKQDFPIALNITLGVIAIMTVAQLL